MSQPIKISIPSPCHENWDDMTPNEKGRFCDSCQKTVLDFTNSTDREIASVLKNSKNMCGRFRTTQLDRELVIPKEKSSLWVAASAAVISFLTLGNDVVSAQIAANTEQHTKDSDNIKIDKSSSTNSFSNNLISGVVCEKNEGVIPGANIKNVNTLLETQTDLEGRFSIEAAIGDKLIISYVGITSKEVIVKSDNLKIIVEMEVMGLIFPERTFFGRIFHSIGNLFR